MFGSKTEKIAKLAQKGQVAKLTGFINDKDASVRLAAIDALGTCAGEESYNALVPLVHAADKLSALIKCMEELKMCNSEFSKAKDATLQAIHALQLPEAELFLTECIPGYGLTLDELD